MKKGRGSAKWKGNGKGKGKRKEEGELKGKWKAEWGRGGDRRGCCVSGIAAVRIFSRASCPVVCVHRLLQLPTALKNCLAEMFDHVVRPVFACAI